MRRITTIGAVGVLVSALLVAAPNVVLGQGLKEAEALNKKVIELYNAGKYAEAIPIAQRALSIREKILGPHHIGISTALNNLSALYQDLGNYRESESLLKRALEIRESSLGPNHPDVATVLNNLAELYKLESRYPDAEPLYKRSLAIYEKAFGAKHVNVALLLNNLATIYVFQGRYKEAEPLLKSALAIRESSLGLDHPDVATSLSNLAVLYSAEERYADAEALQKRVLTISERTKGANHVDVAMSLNNLAAIYHWQGRYLDAEPLVKRALVIRENTFGPNHPQVAESLQKLASLYLSQRQLANVEPLLKRSLAIRERALGPNHPDLAATLNSLAELYKQQGRYEEAEPLLKRALAIWQLSLGLDHPHVYDARYNVASLYGIQKRYSDALALMRDNAQKGVYGKKLHLPFISGALANRDVTGIEALNESFEVIQGANSSAASSAINQLSVRFVAGNDELAQLVRREQDLAAENESLDKLLIAVITKETSKRDLATEERIRDRLKSIAIERNEIGISLKQRFPNFAALSKPTPISVKDTQALLADDEALIAFDFDDQSYAWVITRTNANWIELKITAKQVAEEVKLLRSSLTFNIDKPFDTQLAFEIYQQTFGAIADKLQGKTRLSVITNGGFTSLPLQLLVTKEPSNKPLKDIDWLVRSYAITNLPSVASLKILRSAAAHSAAKKPIIAFADPVFSKDPNVQVVASRNAKNQKIAALRSMVNFYEGGQPDLASLAKALPQLPDTADEVRAIADALKADKSDLKLGVFASEATVKKTKLDDYRIVYFATHGLVAGEVEKFAKVKAEPALALTIPEKPTELDDGLLTASEVAQLKLNADWVILSACNTAAEGNPGAEALSGLARAFFYAGARSLIVSHWEVDSDATAQLMTGTFQAVTRDPELSHGEALQKSILSMIDKAKSEDDAHPRIWAPFVVVGEPKKAK